MSDDPNQPSPAAPEGRPRWNELSDPDLLNATEGRRPILTVIIVNHESWPDVLQLSAALADQPEFKSGLCQIVVVDNASRGPVPDQFSAVEPGLRLIARPENGGFAAGVNAGWRLAQSPWLLVLNPDQEVLRGFRCAEVFGAAQAVRYRPERSAGDCRIRLEQPRLLSARLRGGLPKPCPDYLGAVHTALPQEIPGRLANSVRPSGLGDRRMHARELQDDRRRRRHGRGFFSLLRGSRFQQHRPPTGLARGI